MRKGCCSTKINTWLLGKVVRKAVALNVPNFIYVFSAYLCYLTFLINVSKSLLSNSIESRLIHRKK